MMSCGVAVGRTLAAVPFVLALVALTAMARTDSDARRISAVVVHVHDGDTLVARMAMVMPGRKREEQVRLVGIDCPESGQQGGPAATVRLAALVLRRPVILEVALQSRDRYGRLLAGVYLVNGKTLVQELLVRDGFCRTLVMPPNVEYADRLRTAKIDAQRAERGIWSRRGRLEETAGDFRHRR